MFLRTNKLRGQIFVTRKVLFVTPSISSHLDRFVGALKSSGCEIHILLAQRRDLESKILDVYVTEGFDHRDLILLMPIEALSENYWNSIKSQTYYISLAFDILSEDKAVISTDLLCESLTRAAGVIFDCLTVYKIIREKDVKIFKSLVIPYGINLDETSPKITFPEPKNQISIAALRNWTDLHNQELAIEIVRELAKTYSVVLNVAGSGARKDALLSLLTESNVRINDFGLVEERKVSEILSNSDIYLSSSKVDGSSITLLQAMYSGSIPIVFDNQSNREWITNGENGYLYSDKSESLENISKVIALMNTKDLKVIKMREKSRSIVEKEADWKQNSTRFREFLDL